jgi:Integrator complex subunit 2
MSDNVTSQSTQILNKHDESSSGRAHAARLLYECSQLDEMSTHNKAHMTQTIQNLIQHSTSSNSGILSSLPSLSAALLHARTAHLTHERESETVLAVQHMLETHHPSMKSVFDCVRTSNTELLEVYQNVIHRSSPNHHHSSDCDCDCPNNNRPGEDDSKASPKARFQALMLQLKDACESGTDRVLMRQTAKLLDAFGAHKRTVPETLLMHINASIFHIADQQKQERFFAAACVLAPLYCNADTIFRMCMPWGTATTSPRVLMGACLHMLHVCPSLSSGVIECCFKCVSDAFSHAAASTASANHNHPLVGRVRSALDMMWLMCASGIVQPESIINRMLHASIHPDFSGIDSLLELASSVFRLRRIGVPVRSSTSRTTQGHSQSAGSGDGSKDSSTMKSKRKSPSLGGMSKSSTPNRTGGSGPASIIPQLSLRESHSPQLLPLQLCTEFVLAVVTAYCEPVKLASILCRSIHRLGTLIELVGSATKFGTTSNASVQLYLLESFVTCLLIRKPCGPSSKLHKYWSPPSMDPSGCRGENPLPTQSITSVSGVRDSCGILMQMMVQSALQTDRAVFLDHTLQAIAIILACNNGTSVVMTPQECASLMNHVSSVSISSTSPSSYSSSLLNSCLCIVLLASGGTASTASSQHTTQFLNSIDLTGCPTSLVALRDTNTVQSASQVATSMATCLLGCYCHVAEPSMCLRSVTAWIWDHLDLPPRAFPARPVFGVQSVMWLSERVFQPDWIVQQLCRSPLSHRACTTPSQRWDFYDTSVRCMHILLSHIAANAHGSATAANSKPHKLASSSVAVSISAAFASRSVTTGSSAAKFETLLLSSTANGLSVLTMWIESFLSVPILPLHTLASSVLDLAVSIGVADLISTVISGDDADEKDLQPLLVKDTLVRLLNPLRLCRSDRHSCEWTSRNAMTGILTVHFALAYNQQLRHQCEQAMTRIRSWTKPPQATIDRLELSFSCSYDTAHMIRAIPGAALHEFANAHADELGALLPAFVTRLASAAPELMLATPVIQVHGRTEQRTNATQDSLCFVQSQLDSIFAITGDLSQHNAWEQLHLLFPVVFEITSTFIHVVRAPSATHHSFNLEPLWSVASRIIRVCMCANGRPLNSTDTWYHRATKTLCELWDQWFAVFGLRLALFTWRQLRAKSSSIVVPGSDVGSSCSSDDDDDSGDETNANPQDQLLSLLRDPLLVLLCPPRVWYTPGLTAILLRVLRAVVPASRHYYYDTERCIRYRLPVQPADVSAWARMLGAVHQDVNNMMSSNRGRAISGKVVSKPDSAVQSLLCVQDCLVIQLLLDVVDRLLYGHVHNSSHTSQVCTQDDQKSMAQSIFDASWRLPDHSSKHISSAVESICLFLHHMFLDQPALINIVHQQGYSVRVIGDVLQRVPSLHVLVGFLPQLLQPLLAFNEKQTQAPMQTQQQSQHANALLREWMSVEHAERMLFRLHLLWHLAQCYPLPETQQLCGSVLQFFVTCPATMQLLIFYTCIEVDAWIAPPNSDKALPDSCILALILAFHKVFPSMATTVSHLFHMLHVYIDNRLHSELLKSNLRYNVFPASSTTAAIQVHTKVADHSSGSSTSSIMISAASQSPHASILSDLERRVLACIRELAPSVP